MAHVSGATTFERGSSGYEEARTGALWNARVPEAYPDLIVQARSEKDAVATARLAGDRGLRLAVGSGGHSWAGTGATGRARATRWRLRNGTARPRGK